MEFNVLHWGREKILPSFSTSTPMLSPGTCFYLLETRKLITNITLCIFALGGILSNLWSSLYLACILLLGLSLLPILVFLQHYILIEIKLQLYCMDICNCHKSLSEQVRASLNL